MFVGLHRHSHFSKRDAIATIPDIVKRVDELGQNAWALTDHGTTSGLMAAYKETQKYNKEHGTNIKFIFGMEAYWIPDYFIKDRKMSCHLILLAKNETGYRNLLRLATIGYGDKGHSPDNYFYTMRLATEDIQKHKEGLIVTSACMGGILNPVDTDTCTWDEKLAYERATKFRDVFGENFYLEIQCATDDRQKTYNKQIEKMSKDLQIPVFVTEDSHYVKQQDAPVHRKWLGIDIEPDNPKAYYQTDDYFIHSEAEVKEALADTFDADTIQNMIDETARIADLCDRVEIKFGGKHFPELDLNGSTPLEAVCKIVAEGWKKKIVGRVPESEWPKYKAQIDHELHVLEKCDYLTYFLMTEDFLRWARGQHIRMGIGRGSVGGCLIAYLMDITRIDPIKYGLIFERFAHDKRVSLPDVDIDVPNTRRQDLIQYLVNKYVEVFHVRTFGLMGEKAAIKRAAKSLGYEAKEAKLLPKTIEEITDPALHDLASKYQGIIQNYGCHASAIMLFPSDPTEWCAIEKQGSDYVCAYEYHDLEAQGLLKEDVLGIKTLDAIDGCCQMVKKFEGIDLDLDNIPDDDKETFDMLNRLDVNGCFQIESGGMVDIISKIKPRTVFDLVPLVALYRPSTIQSGMVDEFIQRRNGSDYEYIHPWLSKSLGETYGVMLYQEQAMKIVQDMAGYDLGQADMFRRAIGRKIPSEMATLIPQFIKDGSARGVSGEIMSKLAEWLTNAAAYQFNKSHSAAYGYTCYMTAYLKAHYPAEYFCAYLNAYKGDKQEDLLVYIREIKKHGIKLLPPDVRKDTCDWSIEMVDGEKCIRMAINYISGIGDIPVPLANFHSLPKNKIENLIKAGALDHVDERQTLLNDLYKSGELNKLKKQFRTAEERMTNNQVIYEKAKDGTKKKAEAKAKVLKYSDQKWTIQAKIDEVYNTFQDEFDKPAAEMSVLGMTFDDVFAKYDLSKYTEPTDDEARIICVGAVRRIKHWKQRNGKPMMFFAIESPSGKYHDFVMFNYVYVPLEINKVYEMIVKGNKFVKLL